MRFSVITPLKPVLAGLLVITACAASCKHDGTKAGADNPGSVAAVKAQFDILRDSVDAKWRNVDYGDVQLLGTTGLLLRELKAVPGMDVAKVQALDKANTQLKARRYSQETMSNSALIDQYDAAQDSLLNIIYPVAAPNGNAPTEAIRNYVEGMQQSNATVVSDRIEYDRAAKSYNDYLQLHQAELQGLGGKYANLKPLPLFTIQLK